MELPCLADDGEFWLPPEFLTDDDYLVEKVNKESVFPYETSHGFGDEESFLAGLSRKMAQTTPEDDFSGVKGWGMTRSMTTQSNRCGGGFGCQTRVSSSQAAAWDMYCAATEELAMMNINSGRGLLDHPRKHSLAAPKISNDGSGFYSRQSLQYHKLQTLQFQQLKKQQLMKYHRQLAQQRVNNHSKRTGLVDFSPSAWPQSRDVSGMRPVFLGDCTGKRGSTGTGVFLPRSVDQTSPVTTDTRRMRKPTRGTVLVPARVAHALNLNEHVVHQTPVRSSASFNDASWRQRSNNGGFSGQMKIERAVNEPRLPSDWAY
ncbi:TIP41-like protein [Hirschfeldia incana]|nr:TIP41-like protein [Hirschfeldia incana]